MKTFFAFFALFPLIALANDGNEHFYQSLINSGNAEKKSDLDLGNIPELKITQSAEKINDVPAEVPVPAAPKKVYPEPNRAYIFEAEMPNFSQTTYAQKVEALIASYEKTMGKKLVPATTKKCALKIYTASGRGLETPKYLVRATRDALIKRGFAKEDIYLVDLQEKTLRQTGYLPPFRRKKGDFVWEGSPVIALDTGKFYDARWFFESALPSKDFKDLRIASEEEIANERKSFYPIPLMFGVDFWISLPMVCDNEALGVSGALANMTLWNISNHSRFVDNPANATSMVCAVATTPELREKYEFSILTLEKYQFIGGNTFSENYSLSEKSLWLSANPVVLDFIMWQRMNKARQNRGFDLILPEPSVFSQASRGEKSLGTCVPENIKLVNVDSEK